MTDFHVYILECADGSFYTGHTDNIERRLGQHQAGTFDGYTAMRRPVLLLWNAVFQTRDDAFAFERQVKNWSRAKKLALMAGDWSALQRAAIPPAERETR
jgi:predicted GIY-YIG superfamily endonuclease